MTALPSQRGTSGGSTPLPIPHSQLVDIDFLNAGALVIARKTTAKAATNTLTETDLLNGEFTLPANLLGTSGMMRLTLFGDGLWNTGGSQGEPRFKLKIGGTPTTVLDTGAPTTGFISSSALRGAWRIQIEIMNLGAANAQVVHLAAILTYNAVGAGAAGYQHVFATGQGLVRTLGTGNATLQYSGINSSTIDTTADQLVQFTVTNASNVATTEMKLLAAIMEIV